MIKRSSHAITDKIGASFELTYFRAGESVRHTLIDPDVAKALPDLIQLSYLAFPQYGDEGVERYVKQKLDAAQAFAFIFSPDDGHYVGFHIYKIIDAFPVGGHHAKVLYIDQGGFRPADLPDGAPSGFQDRGLSTATKEQILAIEQPDVVCSSSGNALVRHSSERTARKHGFVLYPNEEPPPAPIVALAHWINDALGLANATLDDRLVRTYAGPVSRRGYHPLLDERLALGPHQHVFNLSLVPWLNELVLSEGPATP